MNSATDGDEDMAWALLMASDHGCRCSTSTMRAP